MKPKTTQTARFIVVATRDVADPMPRSSISPFLPDREQFT